MTAQYLLRLDDACPTMSCVSWNKLESLFDRFNIQPLVAVVPDNMDPELQVDNPDPSFWSRVRSWQEKGWTIAIHGYQHRFHYIDKRRLILPFYDRSEFAGLSFDEQSTKLRLAWRIFEAHGIYPTVWIAPAHCFDRTTLQALRAETPIRIISDGIARRQYYEEGFYWLPQQLWSYSPKSSGLWTICLHPNSMDEPQLEALQDLLEQQNICSQVVSVQNIQLLTRSRDFVDKVYSRWFWSRGRFYKYAGMVRNQLLIWQSQLGNR